MRCLFLIFACLTATALCSLKAKTVCYITGEKCVPDQARVTDIIWKDCTEYCTKCKGFSTGACAKVSEKDCDGYRCKCSGQSIAKSEVLKERATCRLGI